MLRWPSARPMPHASLPSKEIPPALTDIAWPSGRTGVQILQRREPQRRQPWKVTRSKRDVFWPTWEAAEGMPGEGLGLPGCRRP